MTSLVADLVARGAPSPAEQAAIAKAIYDATVELWTLYSIGVAITILRTYARVKVVGWRHLQADDYLAWVAVVRVRILGRVVHRADLHRGRSYIPRRRHLRITSSPALMVSRTTA